MAAIPVPNDQAPPSYEESFLHTHAASSHSSSPSTQSHFSHSSRSDSFGSRRGSGNIPLRSTPSFYQQSNQYYSVAAPPPAHHPGSPLAGPPAPNAAPAAKRSCGRSVLAFLARPFSYRSWLAFFAVFFVSVPFTLVAFVTSTVCAALFLPLVIPFPIGVLFVTLIAMCWRGLGKTHFGIHLLLYKFSDGDKEYHRERRVEYKAMLLSDGTTSSSRGLSCVPILTTFKNLLTDAWTWRCLFYNMFISLACCVVTVVFAVLLVLVPLALIFNFVVVLTCTSSCWTSVSNWGSVQDYSWIFTEAKGSAVTVPVGVFLLVLFMNLFLLIVRGFAHMSMFILHYARLEQDTAHLMDRSEQIGQYRYT